MPASPSSSTPTSPNLAGIDFDIEQGQSQSVISDLVQRVKAVQTAYPNLRFRFTVATWGNSSAGGCNQLNPMGNLVLQTIQCIRLNWSNVFVNLMTMDYGTTSVYCVIGSNGNCDMVASAISAAESVHTQWKVPYSSIQLTPMIGGNDTPSNIFSLPDASALSAYAISKGLGGINMWSFDRDTDCPPPSSAPFGLPNCNSYGVAGTLGFVKAFISALK